MFDTFILLRSRSWTPLGVLASRLFGLRLAERLRLEAHRAGKREASGAVRYAGMAFEEMWWVARARDEGRLRDAIEWEAEILLRHGIDWTLSGGPISQTWPELIPVSSNSVAAEYCGVDGGGSFVLGFDGAVRANDSLRDASPVRVWTSTIFTFDTDGALIEAEIELFPESDGSEAEGGLPAECRELDRRIAARGYSPRETIVVRPFTLDFEGYRFGFERRTDVGGCGYTVLPGSKQLQLPHLRVWYG